MTNQYPFKNLVFQGGGVKAFAYRGVLEMLEERRILPQIERVAGTSAGAMMALLLSFRLSVADSFAIFNTLDFSRIPSMNSGRKLWGDPTGFFSSYLDKLTSNADAFNRLVRRFGWYSTEYSRLWIQKVVADQCDNNPEATFADFQRRGFRDLYIVVTNISQQKAELFSVETTPDVPVAYAVMMSQLIPLFFESMQFDGKSLGGGDYFADGGVLNNYPIHVFDTPQFLAGSTMVTEGINWETLGCRLYTPPDCITPHRPIFNLADYIQSLLEASLEAQDMAYEHNLLDHKRTINVSNCCVQATDFDIKPEASDERYAKLLAAGRSATTDFLTTYTPPIQSFWPRLRTFLRR